MNWDIFATIAVAVISFAGTALGAYFANRKSTALTAYRLEKLEEEVRKHNNLIDRTYGLEADMAVVKEDIEHIEKTLEEMK